MSVRERPWMKFYPADWRADPMLRACAPLARYVWLEMIGMMHEAEPYGHLVFNGQPMQPAMLARVIGVDRGDVEEGLAELELNGVFSRTGEGIIFSRRMVKDEQKHEKLSRMGRKGARCKKLKEKENSPTLKPTLDAGLKPTRQPRDTETQKPEEKASPKRIPLPDDWLPEPFGEGTQSRQIVDGWAPEELARQLETFRAHHAGNGTRWADWQKAWSTWVLNSVRFGRPQGQRFNGAGSDGKRNFEDVVLEEYERRAAAAGGSS